MAVVTPATLTVPPFSLREKHCGTSDILRYFGSVTVFTYGGLYWYNQSPITGVMLTVAGTAIALSHVIEKRCGLAEKTTRAFNKAFQTYGATIQKEGQVVVDLEKVADGSVEKALASETSRLVDERKTAEQDVAAIGQDIAQIKAANQELAVTNQQLRGTIEGQTAQIAALQKNLAQITEQNTRLHAEMDKITALLPSLKATDQELSDHAITITGTLSTELAVFDQKIQQLQQLALFVAELKQQNELLHKQIGQLTQARGAFTADLLALPHNPSLEMSALMGQVQANSANLQATEAKLQQLLKSTGKKT